MVPTVFLDLHFMQCAKAAHLHCGRTTQWTAYMSHALFKSKQVQRNHRKVVNQVTLSSFIWTDLSCVCCLCFEDELKMLLWSIASDNTELHSPSASAVWRSSRCWDLCELLKQDRKKKKKTRTQTETFGGTWHQHLQHNLLHGKVNNPSTNKNPSATQLMT